MQTYAGRNALCARNSSPTNAALLMTTVGIMFGIRRKPMKKHGFVEVALAMRAPAVHKTIDRVFFFGRCGCRQRQNFRWIIGLPSLTYTFCHGVSAWKLQKVRTLAIKKQRETEIGIERLSYEAKESACFWGFTSNNVVHT